MAGKNMASTKGNLKTEATPAAAKGGAGKTAAKPAGDAKANAGGAKAKGKK